MSENAIPYTACKSQLKHLETSQWSNHTFGIVFKKFNFILFNKTFFTYIFISKEIMQSLCLDVNIFK